MNQLYKLVENTNELKVRAVNIVNILNGQLYKLVKNKNEF